MECDNCENNSFLLIISHEFKIPSGKGFIKQLIYECELCHNWQILESGVYLK